VAKSAGIRPGELIIGFDGKTPEMDAYQFQSFVRSDYVADDTVTVEVLRNGKRLSLPMILK
jgi:S1-C subfamily serine protease